MKSLADLRANPPKSRAERAHTLFLAPEKMAEMQALTAELNSILLANPPTSGDGETTDGPPRRVGQGEDPRATEIRARMAALLEEMAEVEGEMRVRANLTDGEWRRWADDHPARAKGSTGYERDARVTGGYCNTDALIEDLATYVHSWNGDPLSEGDWANIFVESVAPGDKQVLASLVVDLYESRLDFQEWRTSLSVTLKKFDAFESRVASESATSDSTAGNQPSSTSTSTPPATSPA